MLATSAGMTEFVGCNPLDATEADMQTTTLWRPVGPEETEDCLVLNIWTPAINDGRKRPVMFWCHGGGFSTGSASGPVYDGANLARRGDVVVVTINHRLNVLGFTYLGESGGVHRGLCRNFRCDRRQTLRHSSSWNARA